MFPFWSYVAQVWRICRETCCGGCPGCLIALEDWMNAFLGDSSWRSWIVIFLQLINLPLPLCLELMLNVLECLKPLMVLSFGWSTYPFNLWILCNSELKYILFAVGIRSMYFIDLKFISNVKNNQWFVIFLFLVHIELGTLKRKVPLYPICILGKHQLSLFFIWI